MPSQLFFTNIPYNCSDREFKKWIESRGVEVESIRIIRDLVAGVSPAFAYADVKDDTRIEEAVSVLNGKKIRNHVVTVKPIAERSIPPKAPRVFTVRRPT
jgi:RNA recognition motif-containing protein